MDLAGDDLKREADELYRKRNELDVVRDRLEPRTAQDILRLLPRLQATGTTGAELDALRQAATGVANLKIADALIASLDKVDASNRRLALVGWVLTVVVGAFGIAVAIILAFQN